MKTKLIIFLSIISSFIIIKNVFADVKIISKNPDYLKRGKLFGEARIANAYGQVNYKPNYKIIKDPTGTSPFKIVENFSPRKGDCSEKEHWEGRSGGITDCNTGRLRLEIYGKNKLSKKLVKKKPREIWYGYYIYIPKNFPKDEYLQPYLNQFYGSNKNSRGGYVPQISAAIFKNKLQILGSYIIDEKNLKGKWHKIEYHIKWSINNDGFVKVYHNNKLKIDKTEFITMSHDFVSFKYGTYSHKDYGYTYPENYQFPGHTIYFAGVSVSKKRNKLKVNKIK
jgi:hypothetical protein|tara:strand:+ start:63 stop:905 length:843 start_codon:yes stop_codon:yes gene_type:complete